MPFPGVGSLRDYYAEESAKIQSEFNETSDGRKAIAERAALVDSVIVELCREQFGSDAGATEDLCLVALGGYGRRALFPHSDVDLLFLSDQAGHIRYRDATRAISLPLWDMRLKLSPLNRTLSECDRLHGDNPEFNISLLDSRFLAGNQKLFGQLRDDVLPRLIERERRGLLSNLAELNGKRHQKEGNTIFHLEPNLKNSPGGLRDYHVAYWVARITHMREFPTSEPDSIWPPKLRQEISEAFAFLAAARCFLHYRQGRDDNVLTYELQAEAAAQGIGVHPRQELPPADWMRLYFRHARAIYGLSTQLLDEAQSPSSSLRGWYQDWRSRRSQSNYAIANGRLSLRDPSVLQDGEQMLNLFVFLAGNGLQLSRETENQIGEILQRPLAAIPNLWERLRQLLVAPRAADALRAMHSVGVLVKLFPEFAVIDSLVIRDFYHQYTVDAHSFIAIGNIHDLSHAKLQWEQPFARAFSELDEPELLFLALLFHDVGKGMNCEDHTRGSLEALEKVLPRLSLRPEEADTVRFLIANHLEMSANLMRRDIFDPATVRAFAEKVGSPERLKLLCLFTYADIRAVNPDALTPWKAESLWQLYVSTANYMSRSLDEERFHAQSTDLQFMDRIVPLLRESVSRAELSTFLEGLPRRYVLAYTPEEIATHFQMWRELAGSGVNSQIEKRGHLHVLTLIAADRPFLFAGISGALAAWGMNIWKAEAFANAAGIVVDTFHFTDAYKTLELNPQESARLRKNISEVLSGTLSLETLMQGRAESHARRPPKVDVPTEIQFDDSSSTHSTLMEIITQDRPGLLYSLSATIANTGCNIEVALVDTEGLRAVDAFYLTTGGAKLDPGVQEKLSLALLSGQQA